MTLRRSLALAVLLGLVLMTWGRGRPRHKLRSFEMVLAPLALPDPARSKAQLGPFHLEALWQLRSRTQAFGSFSALVPSTDGGFLAFSDSGWLLTMRPPGEEQSGSGLFKLPLAPDDAKYNRDVESATRDGLGHVWLGLEGRNAILRIDHENNVIASSQPALMADWDSNTGPEAMVRLRDGRFVVLCEGCGEAGDGTHEGVLFAGDPTVHPDGQKFTFSGPPGYSVTDMAQLPDGRVLILMRRLVWPLPERFAGRIVIADPAKLFPGQVWPSRTLAHLSSDLPVDNFEGLAIVPDRDRSGKVTVWLISDDNFADFQRTLLWKLDFDPARVR